tara:strand:+ start:47 stop:325 length:279 start_codon:yes stop_codon:yes gene_type:complete
MNLITRCLTFAILIIWSIASYQNIIYRINNGSSFNLYVLATGILIPPALFILVASFIFIFIEYAKLGANSIEKFIKGEELDFCEILWLFDHF